MNQTSIKMKKNCFLAFLLVLFAGLWTFVSAESTAPAESLNQPSPVKTLQTTIPDANQNLTQISFEKTTHDFGTVGVNQESTCQFSFKNTGRSLLNIEKVKVTCGCTVASLAKEEFAPGEEGVIDVEYRAEKKPVMSQSISM